MYEIYCKNHVVLYLVFDCLAQTNILVKRLKRDGHTVWYAKLSSRISGGEIVNGSSDGLRSGGYDSANMETDIEGGIVEVERGCDGDNFTENMATR